MTSATPFTRKAGLVVLVAEPVAFLLLLTMADRLDAGDARTAVVTVFAVDVVWWLALLLRHDDQWWARPVLMLALFSIATAVVVSGVLGALGVRVATVALLLGVVAAGRLPRRAALLALFAWPVSEYVSVLAGDVTGIVGHLWLAWAMWREPLPSPTPREGSVPGSPGPA